MAHPGYTIVLNTYRRDECLFQVLRHWVGCPGAAEIRIIWSDVERPPPNWLLNWSCKGLWKCKEKALALDVFDANHLTNRFYPLGFATAAVFSVDDDVTWSCSVVEEAYQVWLQRPETIVGFTVRNTTATNQFSPPFDVPHDMFPGLRNATFNMILMTIGGFMHRDAYSAYYHPKYSQLRGFVNGNLTAEDLLMNAVHFDLRGGAQHLTFVAAHKTHHGQVACSESQMPLASRGREKRPLVFVDIVRELGTRIMSEVHSVDEEMIVLPSVFAAGFRGDYRDLAWVR